MNRHSTRRGQSVGTPQIDEDVLKCFEDYPSTTSARLLTKSVLIFALCGMLYAFRSSILPIGRRCRFWAPTITFVETNMCVGLCTRVQRRPTFPQSFCFRMRPASPYRGFSIATTAMFGQKETLMLHLFTAANNVLRSTFGGHCA